MYSAGSTRTDVSNEMSIYCVAIPASCLQMAVYDLTEYKNKSFAVARKMRYQRKPPERDQI